MLIICEHLCVGCRWVEKQVDYLHVCMVGHFRAAKKVKNANIHDATALVRALWRT